MEISISTKGTLTESNISRSWSSSENINPKICDLNSTKVPLNRRKTVLIAKDNWINVVARFISPAARAREAFPLLFYAMLIVKSMQIHINL
jgi:hypothetical protein